MTVSGYLSEHWGLLIMLMGLAVVILSDAQLERKIIRQMAIVNGLLFTYSISCYVEEYLGNQEYFSPLRPFLSAVNYSLIVFILSCIISIMYPGRNFLFWLPAIVNSVLCFVSLKTGLVFSISETNHFARGTLGYLTYFICTLYLIYFIFKLIQNSKNRFEDVVLPVFMVFTSVLCLLMPLLFEAMALHWFNVTIAIDILFYYIYLLQQYTKRDSLTKLLNRQTYYSDANKIMSSLTGFVALDMDGLKEINDKNGHTAGDTALKTLADCFWKSSLSNQRVYRIGGDEYVILCNGSSEDEVKALISRIKNEISKTSYSCSIGYAMKKETDSLDSLYQRADEALYKEKELYYERTGKKRRHQ